MERFAPGSRHDEAAPAAEPVPTELRRLWAESRGLVDYCRDPSGSIDEDAVADTICRAARNLAQADGACIIFREGERVHYSREDTVAPLWAGQRFPITNCISGWSILHRERVVIEDIYADDRIPAEYYRPTFVQSLAMQPIAPGHPIGAIGVYWRERRRASDDQLALLEKLADVAAIVLENAALRRQQETGRAATDRRRDEVVATVSHELRSPLSAILGWTALLRKGMNGDASFLANALEVIERNGRAAARLVDDLLDMSRILSDKIRLEARALEIAPMLHAAIANAVPAAEAKGITLEAAIEPGLGAAVVDAGRFDQVTSNLLSNAIKFTPAGGRVTVRARRCEQRLVIAVTDTGAGISRDFLPHVFDRYRQAAAGARQGQQGGLGLGLAIARHVIEMHGGSIAADSDGEGCGATFTVTLPAAIP